MKVAYLKGVILALGNQLMYEWVLKREIYGSNDSEEHLTNMILITERRWRERI